MSARLRLVMSAFALAFLVVHLARLPASLEDVDSINLALGVESFDVARHQPHPPGYPVFIALAKLSTDVVHKAMPGWDRDQSAAAGLAIWGVLAGAFAVFVFYAFWTAVGFVTMDAVLAAILAAATPLLFVSAARPLTDVAGLVPAVLVQTWLITGWRKILARDRLPAEWWWGAAGTGVLVGLRAQTLWLTGPLLAWAIGELMWRRRHREASAVVAVAAAGVLVWAVPLVWLTGGFGAYLSVVTGQGTEDFGGVGMLAVSPSIDLLRRVLERTLILPWQHAALGQVVLLFALVGTVRLVRRAPGIPAVLCLGFWPYLVFHATFHETAALRYALPIVVPMAGLAVAGVSVLGMTAARGVVAVIVVASLFFGTRTLATYSADRAPVFRLLHDLREADRQTSGGAAIQMHHQVWWGLRRAIDWYRGQWDIGPQPFPGDREWLRVVDHFRSGDRRPVWLIAHLTRTDTAVFDWRTTQLRGRYARDLVERRMVGRDRLEEAAWWSIDSPGWMLGRGWAVTPEIAGATFQDGRQLHRQPAQAWIRRGTGARRVMVGGRYLGGQGDAELVARMDGREVGRWTVPSTPAGFVRLFELPEAALAGQGAYAELSVEVRAAATGQPSPELGLEQFDAAGPGDLVYAFGDGWQELEENPATGLLWRWSSDVNRMTVYGGARDLTLRLAGESPLEYFDGAPLVTVEINGTEVGRFSPATDFDELVRIPRQAVGAGPVELTVRTSRYFVPAELGDSPDRRRLGLRLYRVEIRD